MQKPTTNISYGQCAGIAFLWWVIGRLIILCEIGATWIFDGFLHTKANSWLTEWLSLNEWALSALIAGPLVAVMAWIGVAEFTRWAYAMLSRFTAATGSYRDRT